MITVIGKVKSDSNGTHIVNILFRTILLLILWEFCITHPNSTHFLVPFISGINPCSIPPTKENLKRNNRNKIKIRSNTNKNIHLKSKNKKWRNKTKASNRKYLTPWSFLPLYLFFIHLSDWRWEQLYIMHYTPLSKQLYLQAFVV